MKASSDVIALFRRHGCTTLGNPLALSAKN
jgi:hypothetical protein